MCICIEIRDPYTLPESSPGILLNTVCIVSDEHFKLIISNASDEGRHLVQGEVLAIYHILIQEPVEAFNPDSKQSDVALNTINENPILEGTHPMSAQAVWDKLHIGT